MDLKTSVLETTRIWGVLLSDKSIFNTQRDSLRILIWRGSKARYHLSHVIEIYKFGGKGILVYGNIILDSHRPLHIFVACTVSECLWTIMWSYTELTLLMNFSKNRIFSISISRWSLWTLILFNIIGLAEEESLHSITPPLPMIYQKLEKALVEEWFYCHKYLMTHS